MTDPCRVSIDELRHDEAQQALDDEEDKKWFSDLDGGQCKVEYIQWRNQDYVEIGNRSFSVKEARRLAEYLTSII